MSDTDKKNIELEYVTPSHRLESNNLSPKPSDVEHMLKLCKEMAGTDIEWAWKPGRSKVFTLKATFPRLKVRDYWDFEQRDDPVWTLIDDRAHGNNLIWQQKTSDCDLVLAIAETQGQRTETQEFSVDLTHTMPLLSPIKSVFSELIHNENALESGHQPIHNSLSAAIYNYFTGMVEVATFAHTGRLWYENGQAVHATTASATGDMAVIEMVTWQLGITAFFPGERAEARTISQPLDFLIHEGIALLEEKRFLAGTGLSYEGWLVRTGLAPSMNAQNEDLNLKARILDHLRKPSTLLDLLRDLELTEWQWVPALFHLLNQNLIAIHPPRTERASALKHLRLDKSAIDVTVGHMFSPKTGLYRYETLMLLLPREYRRFQLHGCPLTLVVLNIKTAETGKVKPQWLAPQALMIVQQRVDLLKRPSDLFTHFEIMDYALLMPDTTVAKAKVVAAQIVETLENLQVDNEGTTLSISCGIAGLPDHATDIENLVKTAKAAMHQAKVLGVPVVTRLMDDVPTGIPDKVTSAYTPPLETQAETITLEDLLVKAEVISREHLNNASALVKQMHTPLARVLTMHGINVPQRVVTAAEEIQALVEKGDISADEGVKTLALIDNHELTVDAALKRLRIVNRQTKPGIFSEILLRVGVISDQDLRTRMRESLSAGLPLGYVLVHQEVISRAFLHDTLDAIRLLRKGILSRQELLQALNTVRLGQASLREICEAQNFSTASIDGVGTAELIVIAEMLSEIDLVTAREIALTLERDIEDVLLYNGFASEECVTAAKALKERIEKEGLDPDEAAGLLRQQLGKGEAPAAQPQVKDDKDMETSLIHSSELTGTGSSTPNSAAAAESPAPGSSEGPATAQVPNELPAESAQPRNREQLKRAGEQTMPLHNQVVPSRPSFTPKESGQVRSADTPKEPPKEVDRVDLLRLAGLVNEQQADGARKLGASTNSSPLRILFDRGMIDEQSLNLSGVAKRKIDAGEVDVRKAIAVIKFCKANNVDFDAGQSGLDPS